jgi:hypothetical protein
LAGKLADKRPIIRHRCKQKGNVKMVVREMRLESVGLIHMPQDTDRWYDVTNTVMNLEFHKRRGIS